jgi:magnesium chelatase family protein
MNPCKCGGGPGMTCRRGPRCAADYQSRVSGPMMDRVDLHIEVPAVTAADLVLPPAHEGSREVRARVTAARDRQRVRLAARGVKGVRTNAELNGQLLDEIAAPDAEGLALLRQAAETMKLSARGFHRVLRVARTLADLDASDGIGRLHIAEALSYRGEALRDRQAA